MILSWVMLAPILCSQEQYTANTAKSKRTHNWCGDKIRAERGLIHAKAHNTHPTCIIAVVQLL